jgi:hypothetical protein
MNKEQSKQDSAKDDEKAKPADPKPVGKTYGRRGFEKQKGGSK